MSKTRARFEEENRKCDGLSPRACSLCAAALAFCVNTFEAIDRHSHSVSDTFYGIFPFWVPALLVLAGLQAEPADAPG